GGASRGHLLGLIPVLAITVLETESERERVRAAGADDLLIRPVSSTRLVAAVLQQAQRARRLEEATRYDSLTGLPSAAMLEDEMELILAQARRDGEQVTLAVLDIDHFRRINEQLGARTGDAILRHVAEAIRQRVRASDVVARVGGEEFGILFRSCDAAQAWKVCDEIRSALLASPPQVEGTALPIRLSAGIAVYGDQALSSRELVLAAERALRQAKETGRDRIVVAR
ncbi:MAG TPA: diguanylate cyclase, partial [Gemmatimonadales bacterium]|nr:diguanylate cyclase [Gemmatimonadales bacterium]